MSPAAGRPGPVGRLGRWTATHVRAVVAAWAVAAVALGVLAPRVETALSGAGWEAVHSESVRARALVDAHFEGRGAYAEVVVVHARDHVVSDPAFARVLRAAESELRRAPAVGRVLPPRPGVTISPDGHAAVILAGARGSANAMVRAADELKGPLARLGADGIQVDLAGAPGMWSDFNQANRAAMMRSELLSWPITLAILVLAFGSLVAAGLPLMLTVTGLIASAGSLWIGTRVADISIWSMNFALMFALALGIDYALFIVYRFRQAMADGDRTVPEAAAVAIDTAGTAVLFSGITVLISLSAVMLVPSPAFRSTALGIMLSVVFVLAAALTLLPAVLVKLGARLDRYALGWVRSGRHHSPRSVAWARRLWRRPVPYGLAALALLVPLTVPVFSLKTAMPSITVVPSGDHSRAGYDAVRAAFGPGATGPLQLLAPAAQARETVSVARRDTGIARVLPARAGSGGLTLVEAIPTTQPSTHATSATIDRLRAALPPGVLVGGPVAENHDLAATLKAKAPLVFGVILALSFLLLMIAVRAPVIAAFGVLTNLLATGAAFGVAKWIFQDGVGHSLLGFQPQGFLDAWGPVLFFAMVFAISMDYTVFLLSAAKEHWDRSGGDAEAAMVGGLGSTGRVIFAASAVMIAVFFTFALSGPLPPKEMGVILGIAVLLDSALVRLLLLPVILRLLGRWAWYLPRPLMRVLPDVRVGHA